MRLVRRTPWVFPHFLSIALALCATSVVLSVNVFFSLKITYHNELDGCDDKELLLCFVIQLDTADSI